MVSLWAGLDYGWVLYLFQFHPSGFDDSSVFVSLHLDMVDFVQEHQARLV